MNSYDRLYEMLIEGAVKASNKAKKREWVRRKGLKDTGEPSYRAIISTRKAARHGQDVAAATVVAGREALKTEGAISTEVKETPGSDIKRILVEGRGRGEQRGRAHLSRLPQAKSTRHLGRGISGNYDPDEGSEEDVQKHQKRTNDERLALLRDREKTATGIQLAQIRNFIRRLTTDSEEKSLKAHTELDMTGYERIYEALVYGSKPKGLNK